MRGTRSPCVSRFGSHGPRERNHRHVYPSTGDGAGRGGPSVECNVSSGRGTSHYSSFGLSSVVAFLVGGGGLGRVGGVAVPGLDLRGVPGGEEGPASGRGARS